MLYRVWRFERRRILHEVGILHEEKSWIRWWRNVVLVGGKYHDCVIYFLPSLSWSQKWDQTVIMIILMTPMVPIRRNTQLSPSPIWPAHHTPISPASASLLWVLPRPTSPTSRSRPNRIILPLRLNPISLSQRIHLKAATNVVYQNAPCAASAANSLPPCPVTVYHQPPPTPSPAGDNGYHQSDVVPTAAAIITVLASTQYDYSPAGATLPPPTTNNQGSICLYQNPSIGYGHRLLFGVQRWWMNVAADVCKRETIADRIDNDYDYDHFHAWFLIHCVCLLTIYLSVLGVDTRNGVNQFVFGKLVSVFVATWLAFCNLPCHFSILSLYSLLPSLSMSLLPWLTSWPSSILYDGALLLTWFPWLCTFSLCAFSTTSPHSCFSRATHLSMIFPWLYLSISVPMRQQCFFPCYLSHVLFSRAHSPTCFFPSKMLSLPFPRASPMLFSCYQRHHVLFHRACCHRPLQLNGYCVAIMDTWCGYNEYMCAINEYMRNSKYLWTDLMNPMGTLKLLRNDPVQL